jgi:hypothetical protein
LKTRYLHASNQYWSGVSKWILFEGIWTCVGPEKGRLSFLMGRTPSEAKKDLEKLGCKWEWREGEEKESPVSS